jgi:hypothetical protein
MDMRAMLEKYIRNCSQAADEAKKSMIANLGAMDVCQQLLAELDKEAGGIKTLPPLNSAH